MTKMRRTLEVLCATAAMILPLATPAAAQEPPEALTLVADGFALPTHIEVAGRTLHVADAEAGQAVAVDLKNGKRKTFASGVGFLTSISSPGGPVLLTRSGPGGVGLAQVTGPRQRVVADTEAWELDDNPDGQPHYFTNDDGELEEYDAISNPYDVLVTPGVTYIADAGANAIWEVWPDGRIRTLAVLPVITGEEAEDCDDVLNNGIEDGGCDAVPTGIALGPDGFLYVSTLGGEVEGRIYKISRDGEVDEMWGGLPPLTDVTVAPDGTVYAASLFGFSVLAFAPDGTSTTSEVPFPTSVSFSGGALYVASLTLDESDPEAPPQGAVYRLSLDSFA